MPLDILAWDNSKIKTLYGEEVFFFEISLSGDFLF